ncbi:MAG: hypothetical protein AAFZ89_01740 [Bacteroidota bacterium]
MKKNKKTYLLLVAVVLIWGLIGFKVVAAIDGPSPDATVTTTPVRFTPAPLKERDTFRIVADYRDPFLGTMPTVKKTRSVKRARSVEPQLPRKNIGYSGLITGTGSGKKIFFLTVDGQQLMLSKNESFEGLKLINGDKDKVVVRYNGKRISIPVQEQ